MLTPSIIAAAIAVSLALAAGILVIAHRYRRHPVPRACATDAIARAGQALPAPGAAPPDGYALSRRFCTAFQTCLASDDASANPWPAFDQLVREMLTEHLGARHVRCYHVRPGADTLLAITQAARTPSVKGPSLHDGILAHVAATGREFFAADTLHGPLLDDLAAQSDDQWTWIWPVRTGNVTIGIVAVGRLAESVSPSKDLLHAVGQLLSLFWQHVACLEERSVLRRTDHGSGVLTRADFFTLAERALSESYGDNEPVVLATIALEGLRRMDDRGQWQQRDALIERIGHAIAGRARSDDLVGRFTDDRFVVLLRRLDRGLARLIAEKILAAACECVVRPGATPIRLRLGLVGSGLAHPPLEELLAGALAAVERARERDATIQTDLEDDAVVATEGVRT